MSADAEAKLLALVEQWRASADTEDVHLDCAAELDLVLAELECARAILGPEVTAGSPIHAGDLVYVDSATGLAHAQPRRHDWSATVSEEFDVGWRCASCGREDSIRTSEPCQGQSKTSK